VSTSSQLHPLLLGCALLLFAPHSDADFCCGTTKQQNDQFLTLITTDNKPVGIHIFSHYVSNTVPDARGVAYADTVTVSDSPVVTTTGASFNAVNTITSLYGPVGTVWVWPIHDMYTMCWTVRNSVNEDWLVACFTNTPFRYVVDQTTMPTPSEAPIPVVSTSYNYVHAIYIWVTPLSDTEMKVVTKALRKELGGVPYRESAPVFPISDLRAYYMRFLIALLQPQSINIFADMTGTGVGSIVPDRVDNQFPVTVTAGTASKRTCTQAANGANNTFTVLGGDINTKLLWPENSIPRVLTMCSVSRYTVGASLSIVNGVESPQDTDFYFGVYTDFHFGHFQGKRGMLYYNDLQTQDDYSVGLHPNDWLVMCATSAGVVPDNVIIDQLSIGTALANVGQAGQVNVNYNVDSRSNFEVHSVYIWNAVLSHAQMKHTTSALRAQIGGQPDIVGGWVGPPVEAMTPTEAAWEHVCPADTLRDPNTHDCKHRCMAGTYSDNDDGYYPCTSCLAGTWSTNVGAENVSTCINCTVGMYSTTSAETCTFCAAGTYAASTASPICTGCQAGKYSTTTGATSSTTCLSCAVGTYSVTIAANTTAMCHACTSCFIGQSESVACDLHVDRECTDCLPKPNNTVYVELGLCDWECAEGFYMLADTCEKCSTEPCDDTQYRPVCSTGSVTDSVCTEVYVCYTSH
jgi:hypothetical protein